MPEINTTKATPSKRRSVLGDLGIKPAPRGIPSPVSTKPPTRATSVSRQSTPLPPAPTRAQSLSRKQSNGGGMTPRTPRPLSIHGTSASSSSSSSSSSSVSPTTSTRSRPVSLQPKQQQFPTSRRSSAIASSRSGSPRLASSPVDSELKTLQDQVTQKDALIEEQEQRVKDLEHQLAARQNPPELKKATDQITCLEQQIKDLTLVLQQQRSIVEKEKAEQTDKDALINEHQDKLKKLEHDYEQKLVDLKMELVTKEKQEHSTWVQERQDLITENQQTLEKLEQAHEKELADLKLALTTKNEQYDKLHLEHETLIQRHQKLEQNFATMETTLASSKEAQHIRDLEHQLGTARQATEALERRFRDEMQQTQNDHDDTAQTWLEKHQRSQTELDRLQQIMVETEHIHAQALTRLEQYHVIKQQGIEAQLAQMNEDRDTHAQHMDALESQIEDLQTRLEEATLRLETATLKSSPNLSPSPSSTVVTHDHCRRKQIELELTLEELKQQLVDQKQHYITQKHKHESHSRTVQHAYQDQTNEKLIDVAKQHKKEVQLLHDQYQQLVDLKDQELEAYAYRVKSINVARQKEIESCRAEFNNRIHYLEHQIEGYEATIHNNNDKLKTLQTQLDQLEQQTKQDQHAIQILTRERGSLRDENDQLIRLVNQLQSELHH
ncbi:hypothetical protein BC941DRAFT_475647 [Chlamydoabsidia padenii]|nr:hypothetical protein BC941DRAFT_475647 [Chlamydoabsidia padenii]